MGVSGESGATSSSISSSLLLLLLLPLLPLPESKQCGIRLDPVRLRVRKIPALGLWTSKQLVYMLEL